MFNQSKAMLYEKQAAEGGRKNVLTFSAGETILYCSRKRSIPLLSALRAVFLLFFVKAPKIQSVRKDELTEYNVFVLCFFVSLG